MDRYARCQFDVGHDSRLDPRELRSERDLPGSQEYEFEPGMVFALEPFVWVDGVRGGGGVRLEDMILITDGEAHVMSRTGFCEKLFISS